MMIAANVASLRFEPVSGSSTSVGAGPVNIVVVVVVADVVGTGAGFTVEAVHVSSSLRALDPFDLAARTDAVL
jgi:hypothetical protein